MMGMCDGDGTSTALSYLTDPLIFRLCFFKTDVSVNVGDVTLQ